MAAAKRRQVRGRAAPADVPARATDDARGLELLPMREASTQRPWHPHVALASARRCPRVQGRLIRGSRTRNTNTNSRERKLRAGEHSLSPTA
jgi:hypothetical protein